MSNYHTNIDHKVLNTHGTLTLLGLYYILTMNEINGFWKMSVGKIPTEERVCIRCKNNIDDECHFFLHC